MLSLLRPSAVCGREVPRLGPGPLPARALPPWVRLQRSQLSGAGPSELCLLPNSLCSESSMWSRLVGQCCPWPRLKEPAVLGGETEGLWSRHPTLCFSRSLCKTLPKTRRAQSGWPCPPSAKHPSPQAPSRSSLSLKGPAQASAAERRLRAHPNISCGHVPTLKTGDAVLGASASREHNRLCFPFSSGLKLTPAVTFSSLCPRLGGRGFSLPGPNSRSET